MAKTKKLKLYGEKGSFKGFIAEIYVKDNKVVIESRDKAVKEILEMETDKAIEEKKGALGIWYRGLGGNGYKLFVDEIEMYLSEESSRLEIEVLKDSRGNAKEVIKKIYEIQDYYQETINKWSNEMREKFVPTGDLKKDWFSEKEWQKRWLKKSPLSAKALFPYIKEQLEAEGHKVWIEHHSHLVIVRFTKISDPYFINDLKIFIFSQREDRHGKHHPAPAKKIRDLGYYVSSFKSLVIDE